VNFAEIQKNFTLKAIWNWTHWWLTPVILAALEAEVRTEAQGQPGQIVQETLW
jgi:hypothetical protein